MVCVKTLLRRIKEHMEKFILADSNYWPDCAREILNFVRGMRKARCLKKSKRYISSFINELQETKDGLRELCECFEQFKYTRFSSGNRIIIDGIRAYSRLRKAYDELEYIISFLLN